MLIALAFVLGVLPSIVWLLYYLNSDIHPEPKSIIAEVFLIGMLSGGSAVGFQYTLAYVGDNFEPLKNLIGVYPVVMIVGWAFIEEYVKYLSAKIRILHDSEFDEPTDAMIYLISAGLGFAAIENILFVAPEILKGISQIGPAIDFMFLRFMTATLLHALASGIIGFFFALAIIYHRRLFLFFGFFLGVGLHTAYNYSIIKLPDSGFDENAMMIILMVTLVLGIAFIKIAFFRLRNKRFGDNPVYKIL